MGTWSEIVARILSSRSQSTLTPGRKIRTLHLFDEREALTVAGAMTPIFSSDESSGRRRCQYLKHPAACLKDQYCGEEKGAYYTGNAVDRMRYCIALRSYRRCSWWETGNMAKQETVSLRKHLDNLLRMKGAHVGFEAAVSDFPVALRGAKPAGAPHSAWQLLEHMRIAQEDILDFSRNPDYREKKFPDDYWPAEDAPPTKDAWDQSVAQFQSNLQEMQELIASTDNDLLAKIPHGRGQTLLREALLVADHNAYHLGQLVFLRKTLEGAKE